MELIYAGPVFEPAGYAEVNRNILLALSRLGVNIRLLPARLAHTRACLDPQVQRTLEHMIGNTRVVRAPFLCVNIGEFLARDPVNRSIGFTMLECDRIPYSWVLKCNSMDEVWVPSSFNRVTFAQSGVDERKLMVMPLGVDEARFFPSAQPLDLPGRRGFNFVSVFEWVPRKGYDLLLRAYFEEFSWEDDVTLILRVHNNTFYDPSGIMISREIKGFEERFSRGKKPAPIILLPGVLEPQDMPRLYSAGDCFVLPSRGEGWDMPAIEAMACGLPAIITNWSGHLEYVRPGMAYLIDIEGLEPVPPMSPPNDRIYAGARWAKPSLEGLKSLMRHVVENREEARQVGMAASAHVRGHYTWGHTARRILLRLGALESTSRRGEPSRTLRIGTGGDRFAYNHGCTHLGKSVWHF